ncbi:hypothetical protein ACPOL_3448 [Acidisarcina polymorpha]|uniref:Uncharacterized protein n=1 Tax=Acidisarcina polymorpha TaxID=2211140 RepID=A0A2Z5G252_9BACT|nr:hypothetical protein ACPOL_3448 [Acidisarcina polymorpha]
MIIVDECFGDRAPNEQNSFCPISRFERSRWRGGLRVVV